MRHDKVVMSFFYHYVPWFCCCARISPCLLACFVQPLLGHVFLASRETFPFSAAPVSTLPHFLFELSPWFTLFSRWCFSWVFFHKGSRIFRVPRSSDTKFVTVILLCFLTRLSRTLHWLSYVLKKHVSWHSQTTPKFCRNLDKTTIPPASNDLISSVLRLIPCMYVTNTDLGLACEHVIFPFANSCKSCHLTQRWDDGNLQPAFLGQQCNAMACE